MILCYKENEILIACEKVQGEGEEDVWNDRECMTHTFPASYGSWNEEGMVEQQGPKPKPPHIRIWAHFPMSEPFLITAFPEFMTSLCFQCPRTLQPCFLHSVYLYIFTAYKQHTNDSHFLSMASSRGRKIIQPHIFVSANQNVNGRTTHTVSHSNRLFPLSCPNLSNLGHMSTQVLNHRGCV